MQMVLHQELQSLACIQLNLHKTWHKIQSWQSLIHICVRELSGSGLKYQKQHINYYVNNLDLFKEAISQILSSKDNTL